MCVVSGSATPRSGQLCVSRIQSEGTSTNNRGQNLLSQRDIKAALLKLRCENDTLNPEMPPLTHPSQCRRFFFGKHLLRRTIHVESNIERGEGRGKVRDKSANVS